MAKIPFRSIMSRPSTRLIFYTPVIDVFSYDTFSKKRVKVGQKDLVSFIDAPRVDCEIYSKLTRFSNGDLTALGGGSAEGIYTDVSGMPTDYNSIMNSVKLAHEIVNKSGKKSITDYLNSAFEQIRFEMFSKPTLESPEPPIDKSDIKEPLINEK